jgi:hypothetical protein
MALGDFLDDGNVWLEDLTKPKVDPWLPATVTDRGGYQVTRRNPQNGLEQIQVPNPSDPRRRIWVDALWNPLKDQMEPVDPKYRPKEADYYSMSSIMRNQFAGSDGSFNFSGPLDLSTGVQASDVPLPVVGTSSAPQAESSSGLLIAGVVVLLAVWWAMSE